MGKGSRRDRRSEGIWTHVIQLVLMVVLLALFLICWRDHYASRVSGGFQTSASMALIGLYGAMLLSFGRIYGAYDIGLTRISEVMYAQVLADIMAGGLFYMLCCIGRQRLLTPKWLLLMLAEQLGAAVIWALIANQLYIRLHPPKATAVIYRRESDLEKLKEIDRFQYTFRVVKQIRNPRCETRELLDQLDGVEAIFVAGVNAELQSSLAKYCVENDVVGYIIPHIGDVIMAGAHHMQVFSVPVMQVAKRRLTPEYLMMKRWFDIVASLLALVGLSPLMLVTALAIKLCDGGHVFYRQTRLTKDGKRFDIIKFRSMRMDAEKDGVPRLAEERDTRVTPVGRVIRFCRIDELPQLFNILAGDMSIVGPRPERPEIAERYQAMMPEFRMRLQVKAGLTGMAQVYGRYNTEPYSKLELDLIYINHMSVAEDIRLMIATVKVLFLRESTRGVGSGQTSALRRRVRTGKGPAPDAAAPEVTAPADRQPPEGAAGNESAGSSGTSRRAGRAYRRTGNRA